MSVRSATAATMCSSSTTKAEQYINATGLTGYPFFGDLILDSLNRTENAMTQAHAFKAAELCLIAQKQAEMVYQAK